MTALRGRVRDGRIELDGELPEGTDVVVLAVEEEAASFVLADADREELEARAAAADRGETIPADSVLSKLRSRR